MDNGVWKDVNDLDWCPGIKGFVDIGEDVSDLFLSWGWCALRAAPAKRTMVNKVDS